MNNRGNALADRVLKGAQELSKIVENMTDEEWQTPVPNEGRTIGVLVHHVATAYPTEIELAQSIAQGISISGLTWDIVDQLNGQHASTNVDVDKEVTLELLRHNSQAAAAAVRGFTDEQLDTAVTISLNADAPLTAQFFIEDHALRHSFHHLANIQTVLAAKNP